MSTQSGRHGHTDDRLERVTLRIEQSSLDELEARVEDDEFPNRSEAIRTAVRDLLNEDDSEGEQDA